MTLDALSKLALRHLAASEFAPALRLYAHLLARMPTELDARMRVGDICTMLGQLDHARRVYAAVAYLDLQAGRPLHAIVAMQALTDLGEPMGPLRDALAQLYGAGSPRIARFGARLSPAAPDTELGAPPEVRKDTAGAALAAAAALAADTATVRELPSKFQPVPLLSELSDRALARVLDCALVRRLGHGAAIVRQGDPGDAFFFVASGQVRVVRTAASGAQTELSRLYEGAIFGEMALIRAEPRSASVEVVGAADVIAFGRDAIRAAADELPAVAAVLERFTRERLVQGVLATSPLFAPFQAAERQELLKRFTVVEVAAGQDVLARGQAAAALYLVAAGALDVLAGEPPFESTTARLGPGDCCGHASLLGKRAEDATVRASRPTTLLALARDYFDRLVMTVPEVRAYLESLATAPGDPRGDEPPLV